MPVNVSAHERNMKTLITLIIIGLVAGIHKGDATPEYMFVSEVMPCIGGFGDWPESYDMECE